MIDYDNFRLSLKRLEQQYENYQSPNYTLPFIIQEAISESVIQRFETCYDCLWKVLRRYLTEGLGIPEVPASPKPVFRLASENGLLAASVEQWMRYAERRIDTAHDYSAEKAQACLEIIGDFIDDAIGLYQTMTGKTWE